MKPNDGKHFVTLKGKTKSWCRECQRAYQRARVAANPEAKAKNAAANRRFRVRHPERVKEHSRIARQKLGHYEYQRAWRLANVERCRQYVREWQNRNRPATVAAAAKRRAAVRGAPGQHTASDIVAQFNLQAGVCYYCGTSLTKFHVDHKTPIARGGSNGPENIVCACTRCNLSKGARTEEEFRERMASGLVPHIRKAG